MPIYEYECNNCQERTEFIQSFKEKPKKKCPNCSMMRLRRVLSGSVNFHFKGTGFYSTDYKNK